MSAATKSLIQNPKSFMKRLRYRLEAAVCSGFAWLVPRLSRERCVRLANFLGEMGYRLDGRSRAVGMANLQCAFGDALSLERRTEVLRQSYRNFARTMVDLFWTPAFRQPENARWIRTHGWSEAQDRVRREKRGIVYLGLHAGNWEWGSIACGMHTKGTLAVAEHFKNRMLDPIFTGLREVSGQTIIPQENSMLRMLRAVKRGGGAAFLADLTVPPSQAATVVRAFGLEMSASILHAVLVQRGNALVGVVRNVFSPDGSVDSHITILDFSAETLLREIAQACWDVYEPDLRGEPGQWMWFYKHFRYRPRDADRPYPFYANISGAYEKMRKREVIK